MDTVYLFLISKICFLYGLGFTSPNSFLRLFLFLVIVITCLLAVRSSSTYIFPGAVVNDYIIGVAFHASNFLLIHKRVPPAGIATYRQRTVWAFREIFAGRWGVKRIPTFSSKDPSYVPTRRSLFISRAFEFMIAFSLGYYLENYVTLLQASDYWDPSGFLSRWYDVSNRELVVRIYFSFIGSFLPYLGLRAGHSLTTCIALIFGADPSEWPPLFGSITEAWTVRRWYS
jgi:hypothetical protein